MPDLARAFAHLLPMCSLLCLVIESQINMMKKHNQRLVIFHYSVEGVFIKIPIDCIEMI